MSKITTSLFQEMVQAGATRLNKQAEYVNSLNVFPVPDGDTGTNMGMTIENGAKEVADCSADFLKASKTRMNWMEQPLRQPSKQGLK